MRHVAPGRNQAVSLAFQIEIRKVAPPCARAVSAFGSTITARMSDRSIINPPSATACPAMLWPPPRTLIRRPRSRPKFTAATTSAVPRQRAIVPDGGRPSRSRPAAPRRIPDLLDGGAAEGSTQVGERSRRQPAPPRSDRASRRQLLPHGVPSGTHQRHYRHRINHGQLPWHDGTIKLSDSERFAVPRRPMCRICGTTHAGQL